MYDTLYLWQPVLSIGESRFVDRIASFLHKPTLHTNTDGLNYITGNILGMNLSVSNKGVSIKGSLCKSYLKNNFKTMTRQDTQRAIEWLSDSLLLPVGFADVRRIDFAQSFIMNHQPESYYHLLGSSNHYKRMEQPKSIYYQNGTKTKLFYNKVAEGKNKGETIPGVWLNKNVLRYELRYKNRLKDQFNTCTLQANKLYNESFYVEMVERWVNEYQSINKNSTINFDLNNMKHPKDFLNQLLLLKINELGQNHVLELVEQLKARKVFSHPEYYSRLKADIKKICKADRITETSELIQELDKKVIQVKQYCR